MATKETPPAGYRAEKVRVLVKSITYRPGSAIDFHISGKVHDAYAGDDLGSFSKADIVDEIDVFRRAGYSEEQIERVYAEAREAHGDYRLPKPLHSTITVLKHSWGMGGKKRHVKAARRPRKAAASKRRSGLAALVASVNRLTR